MALAATVLLLTLSTFAPGWFTDSLKEAASPTLNPERISFPWYLLFLPETLPFFSAAYPFWSLILVVLFFSSFFFFLSSTGTPSEGYCFVPLPWPSVRLYW